MLPHIRERLSLRDA